MSPTLAEAITMLITAGVLPLLAWILNEGRRSVSALDRRVRRIESHLNIDDTEA